jgi:acetyl esterase/lipase
MIQQTVQRAGARDLAIDIFAPTAVSNHTGVILLHGGGWMFGDRAQMHPYAEKLAAHGFTAIAAEYRLLGEAPWPAQIIDVQNVITWVSEHAASLGIDRGKIALEGFSAGGHLALLAAGGGDFGTPITPVAAVVSFFAPVLLTAEIMPVRPPPIAALLAGGDDEVARLASPLTYVAPGFPPTFLLHGGADKMVRPQASQQFFAALTAVGASADLHIYHGANHEFCALPRFLSPVQAEIAAFLDRTVVDPEGYAAEDLALNIFSKPSGPFG